MRWFEIRNSGSTGRLPVEERRDDRQAGSTSLLAKRFFIGRKILTFRIQILEIKFPSKNSTLSIGARRAKISNLSEKRWPEWRRIEEPDPALLQVQTSNSKRRSSHNVSLTGSRVLKIQIKSLLSVVIY